ncbi:MAG: RNA methyltransferase [Bryobacteraceae bacterium]
MAKTEILTSAANPLLKDVRRAIVKGILTERGCWVAETFHLLEEALGSDCEVKAVLAAESVRGTVEAHVRGLAGLRVYVLNDGLFQKLSGTEASQGVMALVRPPEWKLETLFRGRALAVVLDGVQDPGNAGAIVRAAEAFGATGVMFLKGGASPFHPKTVRASAGSLFRVPFVHALERPLARAALQQAKLDIYGTVPSGSPAGKTLVEADLTRKCAFVIGSEGRGMSEEMRGCSMDLSIPTVRVESLNAAVAASILLYEARRQRALAD